ncbi:MAG: Bcr/CflA family efflux MFS transporter [Deltaproteobacteria bacterium]|nr:MAG: Bcr/CflA family efflux MFS transporter [Deltaproteobacteria bacterium]
MATLTDQHPRPSSRRLVAILGVLTALGPLSIDMYLPSFPTIAQDLDVPVSAVQLTLAAYLGGLALGQLLYGALADRLGRRGPLLGGLALYVVGSVACALAPSLVLLVVARFLQALGGCAGLVVSRAVVRDHFDVEDSARLYSTLMLIMGVAPILAPVLGGQLLLVSGWRAIFWILTGASAGLLALVYTALPESLPREERDRRPIPSHLADMVRLLARRRFVRLSVAGGAMLAAMFAYIAGSPFVFMELHGLDAGTFAFVFGANAAGLIATSQANRWLGPRFGVERVLRWGIRIAAVALVGLGVAVWAGAGLVAIVPALFVGVSAIGLVLPNATAAAMAPFDQGAGRASAVMGTLQMIFGVVTTTVVSAVADGTARPMGGTMAVCAVAGLLLVPGPAPGENVK